SRLPAGCARIRHFRTGGTGRCGYARCVAAIAPVASAVALVAGGAQRAILIPRSAKRFSARIPLCLLGSDFAAFRPIRIERIAIWNIPADDGFVISVVKLAQAS